MATEREVLFDYAVQGIALVNRNTVVLTALGPFVGEEPNIRSSSRILSYNLEADHWGGEYPKLCVSERAHAVFRYVQASKRPANIMAS